LCCYYVLSMNLFARSFFFSIISAMLCAAAPDRIAAVVDNQSTAVLKSSSRRNLRVEDDRGPVDPDMPVTYATLYLQPAAGLEEFLADQQNPSSPNFHHWLTPEQFGDRFGLSSGDIGAISAWLKSEGLTVHDVARGRHWITFSGTARQVSHAFHTEIHRFVIDGELHYAKAAGILIPSALANVIAGVDGLDDFRLQPYYTRSAAPVQPEYSRGSTHYIAPDDLATIYDIAPLYKAGIDGTGQKLAIIGETDISLADIRQYRTEFGLAPNDPQVVLYGPDPGTRAGDLGEADLDLEVSGSIARNATIIFVNSANVTLSAQYAVDQNLAPVMSESYGSCETNTSLTFRSVAQQASAQGITWLIASGDSGAATCDRSSPTPQAEKGATVSFPASIPEVTAVGGTEFNEGRGSYWAPANTGNFASALSYIPERVWNDTEALNRLDGGGGGASAIYSKPLWQNGPGVPGDGARDVPDVSFAASGAHDGYYIVMNGQYYIFGGTSASTPLFAGMVALLNQSLVAANPSGAAGLGNINPALYHLAQATTDVFHDTTNGDNIVPCAQGSPNCVNGTLGYSAGPGYDAASGLGSVDAANLIAEWNGGNASTTAVSASPAVFTPDTNIQLSATVSGAGGIPTGTITFVAADVTLGVAALVSGATSATATLSVSGTLLEGGNGTVGGLYSGDNTFMPSSGTSALTLQLPTSGSYVIPSITPNPVPRVGTSWPYTVKLSELAGVATTVTVFTVNGVNNISNLPSRTIDAHGSLSASLFGSGLTVPLTRDFHFAGADADGTAWSRDITVPFIASAVTSYSPAISLTPSSPFIQQNPQADPSCQWSQQVTIQELSGYQVTLLGFTAGSNVVTTTLPQVFGTTRLAPRGMLSGTVCFAGGSPAQESYVVTGAAETGAVVAATASVSLAKAPATAIAFTTPVTPVVMTIPDSSQKQTAQVPLTYSSGSPAWTARVLPAAQTWLTLSASTGSGNTTLTLQASGAGLSNGVYNAILLIAATGALPQSIQIPVVLVVGGSQNVSILGMGNAASGDQVFAPGQLVAVYGNGLASTNAGAAIQPLPLVLAGASATVNGVAAPLWFVSPGQINLQIPYETSAGTAVLGVTNNGDAAAYLFLVSPAGPGIFAYQGSMVPEPTGSPRQTLVGFITGDGDVTPTLATGATASPAATIAQLPHSRQTLSVTIGGEPADIAFNGIVNGLIGVTQVNFTIPPDTPLGPQAVIVTVGGVSSLPVNLTVTAPM
jgi:uncharacterized protein (TIGR03437 family)